MAQQRQERQTQRRGGDGKSWAEWKEELYEAIQQLDFACSEVRQIVYNLRPLVRPKSAGGPARRPQSERKDEAGD